MSRISVLVIFGLFLLLSVSRAEEQALPDSVKFRESYSLGYEFGASVNKQEIEVDVDVLLSAAREGIEGRKPALDPEEIGKALKDIRRKVTITQGVRYRERAARNLEEGRSFLEANKAKEGVKTRQSGLQYKVLAEGTGPAPKENDMVKVHYRGTFTNGVEFDSSYSHGEPIIIHIDEMMRGWTEALQLMKVGAKWKIFVPTELAYAERQFGRIPPNSALIFEIELLDAGTNLIPMPPEKTHADGPSESSTDAET